MGRVRGGVRVFSRKLYSLERVFPLSAFSRRDFLGIALF